MLSFKIDVSKDFKRVSQSLGALATKQIPFAIAQALNEVGLAVRDAEVEEIEKEFPTATPFTKKSVRLQKARKGETEVRVYVQDIAAAYLLPYLEGGKHHLNSRALLNPKNIALNAYGNLPRNKIAQLKGRADVFIGKVKSKSGQEVNGIWQRVGAVAARKGTRRVAARAARPAHLRLLVRFGDALPVGQHLDWEAVARNKVAATFDRAFGRALGRAIATAKKA